MPSRRTLTVAAVAAVLVIAVAVAAVAQRPEAAVTVRDRAAALTMVDFRFHPQALRAQRGRIRLEFRNAGRLPHAVRLMRGDAEAGRVLTRKPGETGVLDVKVNPGVYRYVCPLSHHEELGMYGTLHVR